MRVDVAAGRPLIDEPIGVGRHEGYSAALLPQARWYAVPLGTLLKVSYAGRSVVVKVNDRGKGDREGSLARVLDLSRAAFAYLKGLPAATITDQNAGVLQLSAIAIAVPGTPLGPVSP